MARNKIAEIMQPKSLSGGGTKLPKVSPPNTSVLGANAAAPTSAPPVTPQSLGGAGTPITQQPAVPPAAPPPAQAPPAQAPPAQAPAQQQQPPAQVPAQQQQPPNTANMNLTQDYTPLGADQTAAVMAGNMKPETFTAGISLLNQINLGEEVPPELLKQTQDTVIGDLNLDPQEVGAQVAKHEQGQGLDPARTEEIIADEARQQGVDPEQAKQNPNFMQMLGEKWEGMDDTQRIGLAVGIPMALIGLFSGAMGGNKWIAGALGLAGAAGVGHSMGLFDKLIPGMGKAQEGMQQLSTTMGGIDALEDGDAKNYVIRQAYNQAKEQGGGGFSALSLMPGTDANRLSSAYNQLPEAQELSEYDQLGLARGAYEQLGDDNKFKPMLRDRIIAARKANLEEGGLFPTWDNAASWWQHDADDTGGLSHTAFADQLIEANKTPEQQQQEQTESDMVERMVTQSGM